MALFKAVAEGMDSEGALPSWQRYIEASNMEEALGIIREQCPRSPYLLTQLICMDTRDVVRRDEDENEAV